MAVRTNTTFGEMAAMCRAASSVAVLSHYRPDGDALGSTLAVGLALQAAGKQVTFLNEDPVPGSLRFLPGSGQIRQPDGTALPVELVIALDCATAERLGAGCRAALEGAGPWLNIDHHRSNEGYGDWHYIDSGAPATGEIVHQFLTSAGFPVTREIAENLYVAISTDTGSFQYQGTTARTYEIAAELVRAGIDVAELNRATYENFPRRRVELLRGLFQNMEVTHDGRVASWSLTREVMAAAGAQPEDAEGLIDHLRGIEGVVVAAAFEELAGPEGKVRLSLRSKNPAVDVGRVCALFGGGGHPLAAGARLTGPLEAARQRVFAAIDEALVSA
jgi:phosphoesterase RecJ-like protein